jgi:hypothetical protein
MVRRLYLSVDERRGSGHYQQAFDTDKTTVFALARSDQRWATTRNKFVTLMEMVI